MPSGKLEFYRYVLMKNPLTLVGCCIVFLMAAVAILAPVLATHDPVAINMTEKLKAPGAGHFFGTDEMGRDIFSRIIYGSRYSLGVGISIVLVAALVGTALGSTVGYIGGRTDQIAMGIMDVILSFPSLVLAMALAAALGPSLFNAMLAVSLVKIPVYVRLVRGQVLSLKEKQYVKAARSFGSSTGWVICKHILPNCTSPVLIQVTLGIGEAILIAASLSFIGLGAQPPAPEWGAMINTARTYILDQWWYATFPGLSIFITVMGFNLLGDGVRDILDPRSKK